MLVPLPLHHVQVTACGAVIQLVASLLQLRGHAPPHSFPLQDDASGCCLLFNGELFGGGVHVEPNQNDGEQLLAALVEAVSEGGWLHAQHYVWSMQQDMHMDP